VSRRLSSLRRFAAEHPRWVVAAELVLFLVFFGFVGWALRGSFRDAADDLRNANLVLFALGCVAVAAYYLLFVLGWMRILDDWDIHLSYPAALQAEMVSTLAKYIPGGVWAPAARVVAAKRAGVNDGALVTASIVIEAGASAVAGVIVFVVSLAFVKGVDAPLAPLIAFAIVVAVLLHPRVFRPLASKVLKRFGFHELPPLRGATMLILVVFYSFTWVVGGVGLWFMLRAVGAHPSPLSIIFLGGVSAVGAIVAVLSFFAPSGLGPREASMYGLLLGIVGPGAALGATVLYRVAITLVELLLLIVGGLLLRSRHREKDALEPADARS
jgi:uncharacterized membrane protein YbhN (UPF0104 family)